MNIKTLSTLKKVAILSLGGLIYPQIISAKNTKSPNIIVILADDLGWGDVGYNGNNKVKTPTIDNLAKSGVEFSNFHTVSPISSPSRASLLTGRNPFRMGIYAAHTGAIKNGEITLAEVCKDNGYGTGFFGKWHMGWIEPDKYDERGYYSPPQHHGFEEVFATKSAVPTWNPTQTPKGWNNWGSIEGQPWNGSRYIHNGKVETENLEGDDSRIIIDRVIPFIDKTVEEDKPFMACVWFHAPHEPVVAGPEYLEMYKNIENIDQRHYFGCITAMDDQIARLINHLKEIGEYENTIISFSSDNGPADGVTEQGIASAGNFRGHKHQVFEGGVRVPSLLTWPNTIKKGIKVNEQMTACDFFPTYIELANLKFAPHEAYLNDGISMVSAINSNEFIRNKAFFIGWKRIYKNYYGRAIIDGDFKYLYQEKSNEPELYNIAKDPFETKNIIKESPEIARKMEQSMKKMEQSFIRSDQGGDYKSY